MRQARRGNFKAEIHRLRETEEQSTERKQLLQVEDPVLLEKLTLALSSHRMQAFLLDFGQTACYIHTIISSAPMQLTEADGVNIKALG